MIQQEKKSRGKKLSTKEIKHLKMICSKTTTTFCNKRLTIFSKHVGVHPNTIRNIISNNGNGKPETIQKLKPALHE